MNDTTDTVDRKAGQVVVSAKIPRTWNRYLEHCAELRGETFKGETIRALVRDEIEKWFPGKTGRVIYHEVTDREAMARPDEAAQPRMARAARRRKAS